MKFSRNNIALINLHANEYLLILVVVNIISLVMLNVPSLNN